MKISEIKSLANDFIESPADQGDRKLEALAKMTKRLCELVSAWRGDFDLKPTPEEGAE